jgi:hypothetical protein
MKRIANLYQEALQAAGVKPDGRFKTWLKRVDSVDRSKKDGYAFEGPFIQDKTDEFECRPGVYLLADTQGSRKNQTTNYRVLVMDEGGTLTTTELVADNDYGRERGWALLIRDPVADLVDRLQAIQGEGEPVLDLSSIKDHILALATNDPSLAERLSRLVEYYEHAQRGRQDER